MLSRRKGLGPYASHAQDQHIVGLVKEPSLVRKGDDMRASLAEQMQEWVKTHNFKSSLPPVLLSPLPTCTVHLYLKHLGLSKDKQDAIVLRDRNTVLETLRHKPA